MWSRVLPGIAAFFALLGFLRMPSLDTAILALPVLMVIAILLEDFWDWLTNWNKSFMGLCHPNQ
jgi:hypothetical protein